MKKRHNLRWSAAEDARIRAAARGGSARRGGVSLADLAREFGRTYEATLTRASRIGARRYQRWDLPGMMVFKA